MENKRILSKYSENLLCQHSWNWKKNLYQFSSVAQWCPTLCDPMNRRIYIFPWKSTFVTVFSSIKFRLRVHESYGVRSCCFFFSSVQFSSFAQSCRTLCDPMNYSMPGLSVHHQFPESTQTHVHWVGDAIQPSCPLSSPSSPALNLSQHQGLFQWVSSSHLVAKVLELQHQSFQWIFRTDFF